MQRVTPEQAREQLLELIDAAVNGEEILITKGGEPAVRLVPVARPAGRRQFGSARGSFVMTEDFDDPLPDFDEYRE